ncbi:3-phosphoshikimate 1-carboxyvinyltransferase [bacterium]|nr:3-phosphoshikimate 1-carboxyvinyltransferase [bacterium]
MPTLPASIEIPTSKPINGQVRIPGSKSLTNRAILISALARGKSQLKGVLHSDDTKYMIQVWKKLGVKSEEVQDDLLIFGCNGNMSKCEQELYVGNAGTAARFMTAVLPLGKGEYILTGNERMQQRPISDLISSLNSLGVTVVDLNHSGCPPVKILASGLNGGTVTIPGDKSSQYVSALMMAAPYAMQETIINIEGELVSRTYVEMTRHIMRDFSVQCEWLDQQKLKIPPKQEYVGRSYEIEGDASSASYFFGMAAITGGEIRISGIRKNSTQGDLGLLNILQRMGCSINWDDQGVVVKGHSLKAVDVDMNTMSDVAPTLAVIALFADGTTRIRNVGNMRIKECDRITATVTELRKLGATVEEWKDGLSVMGLGKYHGAELETYDDHRMAMSLTLAGLKIPGVIIQNPACVSKTFPRFYDMFLPLIQ